MSALVSNARLARESTPQLDESTLIVVGDSTAAKYWEVVLRHLSRDSSGPHSWVEKGRKGNLLGTLQAYDSRPTENGRTHIKQIVMLFGTGSRLSPFTQSLRNIKAAFPLPDSTRGSAGLTIAEASIRASFSLRLALERQGFSGTLLTWGDEVIFPSRPLVNARVAADADVIRFGWKTEPTQHLAAQKEWFQVDAARNLVARDLSRQPLDSLKEELADSHIPLDTYLNLGSFAASHLFLGLACEAFALRLHDGSSADWDPYFWQALQCASSDEWNRLVREDELRGGKGLRALVSAVPEFFELVRRFRQRFKEHTGRLPRISVFDFGEPYWIDIGSHATLSRTFDDLFADSESGEVVRTFFGLPHSLSEGGNFVVDSSVPAGVNIRNSVVIGSTIADPHSSVDRAIVLGSNIGALLAGPGSSIIWSKVGRLKVDGPYGTAFRLADAEYALGGHESVTTLRLPDGNINLKYSRALGNITGDVYKQRLPGNALSYSDAASRVASVDPVALLRAWRDDLTAS